MNNRILTEIERLRTKVKEKMKIQKGEQRNSKIKEEQNMENNLEILNIL